MNEAIKNILNKNQGKTICIISHGIAIQAFIKFYNGKCEKMNKNSQLKNAEYIELMYE